MENNYEKFVRWYLRFNGYLTVENFVIHEPKNGHVPEGGEFDTLAVRFPYSQEQVEQKLIQNDPRLEDSEATGNKLIDFVITEVKSGKRNSLNGIWQPGGEDQKIERVGYVLRWLGALSTEEEIAQVAPQLQKNLRARHGSFLFRIVYFSRENTEQAVPKTVPQITFRNIAEFIVGLRTPCWAQYQMGVKSAHEQWDELICKVWEIGSPERTASNTEKVEEILALLSK
jgi:hypothetical protein